MKGQSSVLLTVIALFVVFFVLAKLLGIEMMDEGYDKKSRKDGQSCAVNSECKGNLICLRGTCQKRKGQGQSCADDGECKMSYICLSGACASPRRKGQSCGKGSDCRGNLLCSSGICK